jgi:hypothetical protein
MEGLGAYGALLERIRKSNLAQAFFASFRQKAFKSISIN